MKSGIKKLLNEQERFLCPRMCHVHVGVISASGQCSQNACERRCKNLDFVRILFHSNCSKTEVCRWRRQPPANIKWHQFFRVGIINRLVHWISRELSTKVDNFHCISVCFWRHARFRAGIHVIFYFAMQRFRLERHDDPPEVLITLHEDWSHINVKLVIMTSRFHSLQTWKLKLKWKAFGTIKL